MTLLFGDLMILYFGDSIIWGFDDLLFQWFEDSMILWYDVHQNSTASCLQRHFVFHRAEWEKWRQFFVKCFSNFSSQKFEVIILIKYVDNSGFH